MKFKPYIEEIRNKIELFNEGVYLLASYFVFVFSDYYAGPEVKYTVAWGFIALIII